MPGSLHREEEYPREPIERHAIAVDRRELASILAGLRLLQWSEDGGNHAIPYGVRRKIGELSEGDGAFESLSDTELAELVRETRMINIAGLPLAQIKPKLEMRFARLAIDKLPPFQTGWPPALQEVWLCAFCSLWDANAALGRLA